jgi:hypothetical protein
VTISANQTTLVALTLQELNSPQPFSNEGRSSSPSPPRPRPSRPGASSRSSPRRGIPTWATRSPMRGQPRLEPSRIPCTPAVPGRRPPRRAW